MTSAVLTQVPLAAGGALAAALARGVKWGVAQYGRAPLSNTAIAALATFSLMASSNALYGQHHRHPAPLFAPAGAHVAEIAPVPVVPALRPKPKAQPAAVQTTGSVPALPGEAGQPIGNDEVAELQTKLKALGFLEGTADGFYGPKTARAIRKFEEQAGLQPKGQLTREVLAAIRAVPVGAVAPVPQVAAHVVTDAAPPVAPAVAMTTVPAPAPKPLGTLPAATATPAAQPEALNTLPAPRPLAPAMQTVAHVASAPVQALQPAPSAQPATPAGRPLPQDANDVVEIAGQVAGNAMDTLVAAVNGDVQMGPAQQPMPPRAAPVADAADLEGTDVPEEGEDQVAAIVASTMTPVPTVPPATSVNDPKLVAKVQRGLASLGFLRGDADGVPGEATAKAIRNFEVWNNYDVTGRVSPQLLDLLVAAGAQI